MARCKKCGHKLRKGQAYCPHCGEPVSKRRKKWPFVLTAVLLALIATGSALCLLAPGLLPWSGEDDATTVITQDEPSSESSRALGYVDGDFIQLDNGIASQKASDAQAAKDLLDTLSGVWGMTDVDTELAEPVTQTAQDSTFYTFGQVFNDIPVYGRALKVAALADGTVSGVSGNYLSLGSDFDATARTTKDDAQNAVRSAYGSDALASSVDLVIYSLGGVEPQPAWIVRTEDQLVFVSARDNSVLAAEPLYQSATVSFKTVDGEDARIDVTDRGSGIYALEDPSRSLRGYDADRRVASAVNMTAADEHGNTYTCVTSDTGEPFFVARDGKAYHCEARDDDYYTVTDDQGNVVASYAYITDIAISAQDIDGGNVGSVPVFESTEGGFSSGNAQDAATLYSYVADAIDFVHTVLGRDGFDGVGGNIVCVSNSMLLYKGADSSVNAYTYSTPHMVWILYGKDLNLSYDVVVHEFTHGLENSISGMSGLGEAGALKEAVSDLLASAAEDLANDGTLDGDCDWAMTDMRNLADPLGGFDGANSLPEVYQGTGWANPHDYGSDNGGVHNNSTVISHAGYLMCKGEDLAGDPLTTEQMAHLVYLSLFMLPKDCTFPTFRLLVQNAAQTMVAQGRLTSGQADRVAAAFDKVGVRLSAPLYMVSRRADLKVLDVNNMLYSPYSAVVEPRQAFKTDPFEVTVRDPKEFQRLFISEDDIQRFDVDADEPYSLSVPYYGLYRVTVTDKQDTSKTADVYCFATTSGSDTLVIHTAFGTVRDDSEVSQTSQRLPDERSTRNIALVLDVSGSMAGDPIANVRSAADEFVQTVDRGRIGLVAYNFEARTLRGVGSNRTDLQASIDELSASGGTNIEEGIKAAEQELGDGEDRPIIVLMSDGAPTDGKMGDELISYADELKERGYRIYTVGFNEGADGYQLLKGIASDGCHYEVSASNDLTGFFTDIADEINGTRFMYVRVACPVQVSVTYDGQTLSSAGDSPSTRTDFGTLAFEDVVDQDGNVVEENGIKILRLREGESYDIDFQGTGDGTMDYSIGFVDDQGDYSDFRTFEKVGVTPRTRAQSVAQVSDETRLTVDDDGDGKVDHTYVAAAHETGKLVDSRLFVYLTLGICAALTLLFAALIAKSKVRRLGRKEA